MKIEGNENIRYIPNKRNIETQDMRKMEFQEGTSKPEAQMGKVASYEKASIKENLFLYDPASIERLAKESEDLYGHLIKLVGDLVKKQAEVIKIIEELETGKTVEQHLQTEETTEQVKEQIVKLLIDKSMDDKLALEKLKESIQAKGRLGVEAISERIVGFVKLAAGEKEKALDDLVRAIDKSFKELEQSLGVLPQLTQKTRAKIRQDLEDWKYMLAMRKHPGPVIFIENRNFFRRINMKYKLNKRGYIFLIFAFIIFFYILKSLVQYLAQN